MGVSPGVDHTKKGLDLLPGFGGIIARSRVCALRACVRACVRACARALACACARVCVCGARDA